MAIMPGFEGHTTFGNRPTGCIVARYRNMEEMDGIGHSRGFSFQGGALQSTWTAGKRDAGIGAAAGQHQRRAQLRFTIQSVFLITGC